MQITKLVSDDVQDAEGDLGAWSELSMLSSKKPMTHLIYLDGSTCEAPLPDMPTIDVLSL